VIAGRISHRDGDDGDRKRGKYTADDKIGFFHGVVPLQNSTAAPGGAAVHDDFVTAVSVQVP
jgi:hypothetical protein